MDEWYEQEDFWRTFYGFMFSPDKFSAAQQEVEKVLKLTSFHGKRVLDLACGPGRHAVPFAQKGFTVTGIDGSKYLLEKAKAYADENSVPVEWIHQDMRSFVRQNSFDLAISLFTSFGYFDSKDEDLLVLKNIFEALKAGGIFLIDTMGKERFAKMYQPTIVHEMADGGLLIERPKVVENWSRIHNHWILLQGNVVHQFDFRLNIYSGIELKELLLKTGFSNVRLYGDLDGHEFDTNALRLVAVAQKPTP